MAKSIRRSWLQPRLSFKITTPYLFLSLALGLAAVYLVARFEAQRVNDAFSLQLSDAGQRVADSVVRQENEQLEALRSISRTSGVAEALKADQADTLRRLTLPLAVNKQIERIMLLDAQGKPVLGMQKNGSGAADYAFDIPRDYTTLPFVVAVLESQADEQGDKYIGMVEEAGQPILYTSGPVFSGQERVGAVLVGTPLRLLAQHWRQVTLADVTIYAADGSILATSLGATLPAELRLSPELFSQAMTQLPNPPVRELSIESRVYRELLSPWRVRNNEYIGALGASLSTLGAEGRGSQSGTSLLLLFASGIIAIVAVGLWLARLIVVPIRRLVSASKAVATGDLSQQLQVGSRDELGELTSSFNLMVAGLRERERMRDVLGRFVSPTVANLVLQQPLKLSGEMRFLSILFTDIRDFTTMAEQQDPADVVSTLNDYFAIIVEATERHGGLVNKFGGDSTLMLFGLTDADDPTGEKSARAAVAAALDIRAGLDRLNRQREQSGLKPVLAGMGINTGRVIAGLIGAEQRMEYTVIGDAVNLSARIQGLTRTLGGDILISGETFVAIGEPQDLLVEDLGLHLVKGKQQDVHIYSVLAWEAVHA